MDNRIWWIVVAGCAISVLYLISAVFGGHFAPQQRTEVAVLALAFAVVPYCLAQAVLGIFGDRR